MTARRSRGHRRDEGISSLIGFILAMVVLVGATASVAWVIASQPDPDPDSGSGALQAEATRALNQLATTPGHPTNWHTLSPDTVDRLGLLVGQGSEFVDWDKVHAIEDGTYTHENLLDLLDLRRGGYSLDIEGVIQANPLLKGPAQEGWGVVETTRSGASFTPDGGSMADLAWLCSYNDGCATTLHEWKFRNATHPSTDLGDIHGDHPWLIETQLIPQMAGLAGTYAVDDGLDIADSAYSDAIDAYEADGKITRWRVFTDDAPCAIPGDGSVLGVAFLKPTGSGCETGGDGWGQWVARPGQRAWAVLGPYDVSQGENLQMSLESALKLTDDGDSCAPACWHQAARLIFWNATKGNNGEWDDVKKEGDPCLNGGTSNWDPKAETGESWTAFTVNLCQAQRDSLGQLWLGFYWDTWCGGETRPNALACTLEERLVRSWFIDNIEITMDVGGVPTTVAELDFEPGDGKDKLLAVGSGVDHGFPGDTSIHPYDATGGTFDRGNPLVDWFTGFVKSGGDVIAFEPEDKGNWLGTLGLQAEAMTAGEQATTDEENIGLMRMPNKLNVTDPDYETSTAGWKIGTAADPTVGGTGGLPDQHLTTVQSYDGIATLLTGVPFPGTAPDGPDGQVSAVAYDLVAMQAANPDLANGLVENLYGSAVFQDPTFKLSDNDHPTDTGVPMATARRIALVTITEDDRYTVPVEITFYLWPQCVDDASTPGDDCLPP